ncbi:MAG TPA: hypothetical protein VF868_09360 [Bacteroidia bacterium]|jgi:Mg2+ and Co2+ transporter CorA
MKKERAILIILVAMNFIVLLGQLWPEGAPPFAGIVNIIFLVCSLLYFIFLLKK